MEKVTFSKLTEDFSIDDLSSPTLWIALIEKGITAEMIRDSIKTDLISELSRRNKSPLKIIKFAVFFKVEREFFSQNSVQILQVLIDSKHKDFVTSLNILIENGLLTKKDILDNYKKLLKLACKNNNAKIFSLMARLFSDSVFMDLIHKDDFYKKLLQGACRYEKFNIIEFLIGYRFRIHSSHIYHLKRGIKYRADESKISYSKVSLSYIIPFVFITIVDYLTAVFYENTIIHTITTMFNVLYGVYVILCGYFAYNKFIREHREYTSYITMEDIRACGPDIIELACLERYGRNILRMLIWKGLTIEDIRTNNNLALKSACKYDRTYIVRELLYFGINYTDFLSWEDFNPLEHACQWNHREMAEIIIQAFPVNKDGILIRRLFITRDNNLAFRIACGRQSKKLIRMLIYYGITPNDMRANDKEGLISLCRKDNDDNTIDIVLPLMSADDFRGLPLYTACLYKRYDLIEKLLKKICQCPDGTPIIHDCEYIIRAITEYENHVLIRACKSGAEYIIKLFINYGLDADHVRAFNGRVLEFMKSDKNIPNKGNIYYIFNKRLGMSYDEF